MSARMMRFLRTLHLYLGCLFCADAHFFRGHRFVAVIQLAWVEKGLELHCAAGPGRAFIRS